MYAEGISQPEHSRRKHMCYTSSGPHASACVGYQNMCVVEYMSIYIYVSIYIYAEGILQPKYARRECMRHSSSGPRASACVKYENMFAVSVLQCIYIFVCIYTQRGF